MKKLSSYAEALRKNGFLTKAPSSDIDVSFISYTSKDIKPGTLFICKGAGFKEEYLKDAALKGATCYMSEREYDIDIPCLLVNDVISAMSVVSAHYYDYPQNELTMLTITGTKGKSTTAYYLKYILDSYLADKNEEPAAIISTIDTDDGIERFESHMTTPEGLDLFRHLRNAVSSGRKYCILESSSQALKYGRLYGIRFAASAFLNISEDHISPIEHADLEDYFTSKLKIFSQSDYCAYNLGADMSDRIAKAAIDSGNEHSTFGFTEDCDLYGYDLVNTGLTLRFKAKCNDFDEQFELAMPGRFNVENALAAIAICHKIGVPIKNIRDGLSRAKAAGRMEVFSSADGKKIVIVDYAHNYLSMSKLYEAVKEEYKGRQITTVFGCPGGKAVTRRRDLGMVAGINSDIIYLTEEDPNFEPVRKISEDIAQYACRNCDSVYLIDDRTEAIRRAIADSSDNAVILLTAKGRETRQKRMGEYVDCVSDVELTEAFLAFYDKTAKTRVRV